MTALPTSFGPMPTVQLFILSRDRTDFCREAVASAVGQTYEACEIVVSDNSVGEEVSEMLQREYPYVKVIRRRPTLLALEHFNQLIVEATAPLMVMFHDDDVLEPDYVTKMVQIFDDYSDISAVGCNARIIRGRRLTSRPFMGDFKGTRLLQKKIELLEPYLSLSLTSPAPFPGYMYRTAKIRGLRLEYENGGKHADVSFLTDVLACAPVLWTDQCLFRYRFHGSNDSSHESIGNRLSWLRYIYRTADINPRSTDVMDYKFLYWCHWLRQTAPGTCWLAPITRAKDYRRSIAVSFVLGWLLRTALTRMNFWRRALRVLYR
jgi:hypothetical protein